MTTPPDQPVSDKLWVSILIEALPYIRAYQGATVVIKYGGHAMVDPLLQKALAQDAALLHFAGINPVIVHGGGPQIDDLLKRLDLKSHFVEGHRYTDSQTLEAVRMVLGGIIGKDIAGRLSLTGTQALALTGQDSFLIRAEKKRIRRIRADQTAEEIDIGLVGEPAEVNASLLNHLLEGRIIPVISPIGADSAGQSYNINADTAAAAVAVALKAARFLLLTDVPGVLDENKKLLPRLTSAEIDQLNRKGAISGGMLPKLAACQRALAGGCQGAAVIDGRVPHAVLLELLTDRGYGTEIAS
ncbi:MAG: acetylglutamate kinase [Deltaproteobacteria bacterium]|jgi:acetylglutamate kinase|nr:acetylglutamate kinase [Deltaproteobacteria bacterium]